MKAIEPFGTIRLENAEITPATKSDTRKKNAFIISRDEITVYISVPSETIFAEWLDAIMREAISAKEQADQQDTDLVQVLESIPLINKISVKPEPTESTSTTDGTITELKVGKYVMLSTAL